MSPRNARATSLLGGRLASAGVSVYLRDETDERGAENEIEANTAVAADIADAVAADIADAVAAVADAAEADAVAADAVVAAVDVELCFPLQWEMENRKNGLFCRKLRATPPPPRIPPPPPSLTKKKENVDESQRTSVQRDWEGENKMSRRWT